MAPATVLAATLTIVFEGLVAFIGPDSGGEKNKTHVAIVTAQHHKATMTLKEPGDSPKTINLKGGDRITFSTGSGIAKTDTTFDDRVPTMSDYIQAGDLDDRVKRKEPLPTVLGNVVLGYVELPNGTLTAEDALQHPAQFTKKDGTKEVRCPARIVRFTMTPDPTGASPCHDRREPSAKAAYAHCRSCVRHHHREHDATSRESLQQVRRPTRVRREAGVRARDHEPGLRQGRAGDG